MKSFFESHIWPMRGKLYRMVYLWTKDRDLSEDVLQNVFEKSVERQKDLQSHPNIAGWMVKSLKNEVLMHFRKEGRTDSLDLAEDIPQQEVDAFEHSEAAKQVFVLLEGLPQKQKEVFQLREVEEMSYEEISQYLGISLEQVKVNLHRARKTIREKLINQGITL